MRSLTFSQPVERFENGSDMSGFRSLNNSTSKRVLNVLEPVLVDSLGGYDRESYSSQV